MRICTIALKKRNGLCFIEQISTQHAAELCVIAYAQCQCRLSDEYERHCKYAAFIAMENNR